MKLGLRVLTRYLVKDFLVTFLVTAAIFTFVMGLGAVVRAIDLLARGGSGWLLVRFFAYNLPFMMSFTIPMSVLASTLLMTSRMSFDGEITALRSCGLSLWQVVSPLLVLSILLSGVCLYINLDLSPNSSYARRTLLANVGIEEPLSLIEEGRFTDAFPGFQIRISRRRRTEVEGVVVYDQRPGHPPRTIRAERGEILEPETPDEIAIALFDVRIEETDPQQPQDVLVPRQGFFSVYPMTFHLPARGDRELSKKTYDLTFGELIGTIRALDHPDSSLSDEERLQERAVLIVEANKRVALSLSCFAFCLLGIPLGLRSRRKDSSIGIGISLALVFLFYFFIILAKALSGVPGIHPHLVVWIPVLVAEGAGAWLITRNN